MFEGNALLALIDRLRGVFIGRREIINSSGALVDPSRTGKGLQAQISDYNVYSCSSILNLSTAYADVAGMTTGSFTPAANEYACVTVVMCFNQGAGTAACNTNDVLYGALDVYYSASDHLETPTATANATANIGVNTAIRIFPPVALTAGTAYELKVQSKNATGARGRVATSSHMMVWRVAR